MFCRLRKKHLNLRGDEDQMMKKFNTTGLCVSGTHYMVDISGKIEQIMKLVNSGYYFTINQARQYGKTTTLYEMEKLLKNTDMICISLSFENDTEHMFISSETFCQRFLLYASKALEHEDKNFAAMWLDKNITDFGLFGLHLDKLCAGKRIVLLIDEVDKTSRNSVFLGFLGMLRNKYLARPRGTSHTFHSVVLAGVHDIKNIKLKLEKEGLAELSPEESQINSPWNIAADFRIDMSFSPSEITTMLDDYENDWKIGIDTWLMSNEIHKYTGGYPFLVSRVCQFIDERLNKNWSVEGVREAINLIIGERSTLFDDLAKNLENYKNLRDFLYKIVMHGAKPRYMLYNEDLHLADTFGYIREEERKASISNKIFEILLADYFVSIEEKAQSLNPPAGQGLYHDITESGSFNMEFCLRKFAEYYREIYTKRNISFLEEHGALIFLSFLKPLINGHGFFHIESQLMDKRRIDIIAEYKNEQFIIELKLWRGEAYRENAISQLLDYMEAKNLNKGYLLTYDLRKDKNKHLKEEWIQVDSKQIFEMVI